MHPLLEAGRHVDGAALDTVDDFSTHRTLDPYGLVSNDTSMRDL